jgi:hypothetical protein
MKLCFSRPVCALGLFLSLAFTLNSSASTISFSGSSSDGHAISGSAEFTPGAGTVTVKLTNTTASTLDAGELFTGLDFSLGGLTPSLSSKTAIERTVDGSGSFTDSGSAANISWSLASLGSGNFQLNFTPNADDGIIGPPSGGNYAGANGSIKGNAGHNPFAAESATFVLDVPGATAATQVTASTFRFGTTLDPTTNITTHVVPEPASSMLLLLGLTISLRKRSR